MILRQALAQTRNERSEAYSNARQAESATLRAHRKAQEARAMIEFAKPSRCIRKAKPSRAAAFLSALGF